LHKKQIRVFLENMSAAAASEELMASAVTQVSDDLSRTEEIDVALDEDAIVAAPVDDATTAATPTVPSIAEQASIVRDLDTGEHKVELKEGDYWFLVDAKWVRPFFFFFFFFAFFLAFVQLTNDIVGAVSKVARVRWL
jgi:hypothetical protein